MKKRTENKHVRRITQRFQADSACTGGALERCREGAIQLLFPRRCPVCDEIVRPRGQKICLPCLRSLKYITAPYCMKCGKRVEEGQEYCRDCSRYGHSFVCGRALYEYGSISAGIYRFKYGERLEYADFWGEELALYLGDFIRSTGAGGLVPVPLHHRRKRKRGYNQAAVLAKALGRCLQMPVYEDYVMRVKDTAPMKLLSPSERQNNLKKAFIIKQNDVKLEVAIVIDDIYTTGCTMDAVSEALLNSGVKKVYFVALSCGALV